MKRVIIVRHAKSVPYGYDDDFHRDLTDRGIKDADKISLKLKDEGIIPDLVIASPATRALHTASIFCKNLGYDLKTIRQEMDFYEDATNQDFIEVIQQLTDKIETVFIFGHNPPISSLVYNLVKSFSADMPTCSTVGIEFPVDKWVDVDSHGGKVAFQYVPKSI